MVSPSKICSTAAYKYEHIWERVFTGVIKAVQKKLSWIRMGLNLMTTVLVED
jgi:hypothetical protein